MYHISISQWLEGIQCTCLNPVLQLIKTMTSRYCIIKAVAVTYKLATNMFYNTFQHVSCKMLIYLCCYPGITLEYLDMIPDIKYHNHGITLVSHICVSHISIHTGSKALLSTLYSRSSKPWLSDIASTKLWPWYIRYNIFYNNDMFHVRFDYTCAHSGHYCEWSPLSLAILMITFQLQLLKSWYH